ncbi:hypothetical protein Baya_5268 [Bagarius yarrelli]|uniref:Uncharacterized protein n=1 Tax=Bagarius yarrelli TaxID=175774 RepID=A0A556TU21_BAGYA|nr:hypothetical protein Baya_5268 [Bagarius yarrelli]
MAGEIKRASQFPTALWNQTTLSRFGINARTCFSQFQRQGKLREVASAFPPATLAALRIRSSVKTALHTSIDSQLNSCPDRGAFLLLLSASSRLQLIGWK